MIHQHPSCGQANRELAAIAQCLNDDIDRIYSWLDEHGSQCCCSFCGRRDGRAGRDMEYVLQSLGYVLRHGTADIEGNIFRVKAAKPAPEANDEAAEPYQKAQLQ